MTYRFVISSGHGLYVRGACGILDEVDEARRVVEQVADELRARGVTVTTYHDDVSKSQGENLERITDFHNSCQRDLDVSVHFNAYVETTKAMGTEVLYVTQKALAAQVSSAIADAGCFIDRGAKQRSDLYFLQNTSAPALLLETCFVDSETDADLYQQNFDAICASIADCLGGSMTATVPPPSHDLDVTGTVSWFGGPTDTGVDDDEPLAFIHEIEQKPEIFLPFAINGDGLARRLNPWTHFVACRWDYGKTPKSMLLQEMALVRSLSTGIALRAFPADWGPHEDTGRVADISKGLMLDLGIQTDDVVQVIFPYREDEA